MQSESNEPNGLVPQTEFPVAALVLGFLPAVFILIFISAVKWFEPSNLKPILIVAAALSLGCCIASSTMLFKRRTALAVITGLILLVLNTVISLFFGCSATITDSF